jgi:arylformamidase
VSANSVIYRDMNRAELDAAYNNSEAVADSPQYLKRWREASERVRARPDAQLDIVYGERPRARLDYFPSGTMWPALFLFIHGGYWQRNEKEMFAFIAEGPLRHGIDVAVVGYTLAPDASLTEIVGEIYQALDFLCARADELGFDCDRLFVGGWSAGGHLTAAAAAHPACAGGLPISGIFDLEPIALNYLNEKLRLTTAEIAALSPLRHLSSCQKPLRLAVGGGELPELRRQSETFARAANARDLPVQLIVLDGHHHFSILDELARPDGALTRELLALIGRT